jgi:lipopolysaccharide heptosyltransferase I
LSVDELRSRDFRRILLIKLSAVGDVVHTVPVLNKLRRRFPDARIDWLMKPAIAEMLQHHPAISNIVLFGRNGASPWSTLAGAGQLAAALATTAYDLVLDMHGQLRTALLTLATRAPVRIGFDRPRQEVWAASSRTFPAEARKHAWMGAREGSWLAYTHHMVVPTLDVHAVDRYLSVGPMLGLDNEPADFAFPILREAEERLDRLLRREGLNHASAATGLVTIAPGTIWETKHWRSEGFAEVARHFMRNGFAVVLTGSARERPACETVAASAPGAIDLAGETRLDELAALIRRSSLCVTNDSGPMHLAVALDRPVVAIFGPTDDLWIGPYRRRNAVLRADLACAPCYLRVLRRCPYDHACMRDVSATAVIARAEELLAASSDELRALGAR